MKQLRRTLVPSHIARRAQHSIYQQKVVFLNVTQINLVNRYQSFRDTCYLHLQD